ncbi:hypothetical protein DM02DRAFT_631508 [Periconia macrospinosa]|uniref:Uncharacterized protein n=1 Tax=Periconia macrospinosa TaxID=97972 RepID=A0A2V1DID9_9PLEO|nr:hypothetical protein DM02DRAFT_631508 [Periconia macrospinosa]
MAWTRDSTIALITLFATCIPPLPIFYLLLTLQRRRRNARVAKKNTLWFSHKNDRGDCEELATRGDSEMRIHSSGQAIDSFIGIQMLQPVRAGNDPRRSPACSVVGLRVDSSFVGLGLAVPAPARR